MIDVQTRIKAVLWSANLLSQDDAIEAAQAIEQLGNVASGNLEIPGSMLRIAPE
jgi:hypothetical protein